MKTLLLFLFFTLGMASSAVAGIEGLLPPFQETPAYKQYQKRPKSELSKILYLMDRFKKAPMIVIYDRVEYEPAVALKYAKSYVAKHYHREDASEWIQANAYRSLNGSVIYVKDANGNQEMLRDLLVQELKRLS